MTMMMAMLVMIDDFADDGRSDHQPLHNLQPHHHHHHHQMLLLLLFCSDSIHILSRRLTGLAIPSGMRLRSASTW